MSESRELWLTSTLVELADTLVADFDLADFLAILVSDCVALLKGPEARSATTGREGKFPETEPLDGPEAGMAITNREGKLRVLASSTDRMKVLELVELQNDEGPCRDCFYSGKQILNQRTDLVGAIWPHFSPLAREAGFQMLHAIPMRLRNRSIGAINIFDPELRAINTHEAEILQALADVATIGIVQERHAEDQTQLVAQLTKALGSRVVIEQAKGIISERLTVTTDSAFKALRIYSRASNLRLSQVASDVVESNLSNSDLAEIAKGLEPDRHPTSNSPNSRSTH